MNQIIKFGLCYRTEIQVTLAKGHARLYNSTARNFACINL